MLQKAAAPGPLDEITMVDIYSSLAWTPKPRSA